MNTLAWIIATNLITAFIVWRSMAFYARNLPAVLDRTNGSKLHEYLSSDDVEWIRDQLEKNPDWLRKERVGF